MRNLIIIFIFIVIVSGCVVSQRIANHEISESKNNPDPENNEIITERSFEDGLVFLSFSGGGTRAASLAYGVLKELNESHYIKDNKQQRILDEVDYITSVSGGSFTAAYYGLFGDKIFNDFETVFLKKKVQYDLIRGMFNPFNWFKFLTNRLDRTRLAINYYDRNIFDQKTFADFRQQGPKIIINASELGTGSRFQFVDELFELICSDLDQLKVASAVAASSAVPVLFAPILIKNYEHCDYQQPLWLSRARQESAQDLRLKDMMVNVDKVLDKKQLPFLHLVDGGITDNLGVRTISDAVIIRGGIKNTLKLLNTPVPKFIAVILVNAQIKQSLPMSQISEIPSSSQVMSAVTDIQLDRYNTESITLMEKNLQQWQQQLSTSDKTVETFFIQVDFEHVEDEKQRYFFNKIQTSFALDSQEVDLLINEGQQLLKRSPEYQALIKHLNRL